jgi:hypothetical protein
VGKYVSAALRLICGRRWCVGSSGAAAGADIAYTSVVSPEEKYYTSEYTAEEKERGLDMPAKVFAANTLQERSWHGGSSNNLAGSSKHGSSTALSALGATKHGSSTSLADATHTPTPPPA